MSTMSKAMSEGSQMIDYFEEDRDGMEKSNMEIIGKEVDPEIFKTGLY